MNRKARRIAAAIKRGKQSPPGYMPGHVPGAYQARLFTTAKGQAYISDTNSALNQKGAR